jgi:hypothetical protein
LKVFSRDYEIKDCKKRLEDIKSFLQDLETEGPRDQRTASRDQDRKFEALLRTKGLNEFSNQDLRYLLDLRRCQDIKSEDAKRVTKSEAHREDKEDCVRNPGPKHSRE